MQANEKSLRALKFEKMKKLKNKIEKLKDACEGRILDREEIFENRTEKWQESEKGEAYEDETFKIQEWYDQLDDMLEYIDYN